MGFSIKHSLRKADISKTNQYFINTFMPKIRFTFFFFVWRWLQYTHLLAIQQKKFYHALFIYTSNVLLTMYTILQSAIIAVSAKLKNQTV